MTSHDLKNQLLAQGCKRLRQGKGSHEVWVNKAGHTYAVPHPKKNLGKGLVKSILKWAAG